MTKQDISWTSVQIKFQTAGIMPPPYSYFYTVALRPHPEGFGVNITMHYLDRDELDEESILEEGFTLNDDLEWKGNLSEAWQQELQRLLLLNQLDQDHAYSENDNYLEIVVEDEAGNTISYFPRDHDGWNYFQHELLQAIYEASDRENPFIAEYLEIDGRNELRVSILASFENRRLTIQLSGEDPRTLPWNRTREIMETIFRADFLADYAFEKEPAQNGTYLNVGDGLWYEFGESLVEPAPKARVLPQIVQLFDTLREEIVR